MKIAIIGAGVVGVTTAHALHIAGHEVHVFEQGSSAAQGASFAHSGVLGTSLVKPFFGHGFAKHWLFSWVGQGKTVHWKKLSAVKQYHLALKAAWHAREKVLKQTIVELNSLADYSAQQCESLYEQMPFEFEQGKGLIALYSDAAAFGQATQQLAAINANGLNTDHQIKALTPEQALALDPALSSQHTIMGALFYPSHSYGNCALFTKQLKASHELNKVQNGVDYHLNTRVTALQALGEHWVLRCDVVRPLQPVVLVSESIESEPSYATNAQPLSLQFDAIVLAAGAHTPALLSSLGIHYPTLNTLAYNVTLPVDQRLDAPKFSVYDAQSAIMITPLGTRLRVSGQHGLGAVKQSNKNAYKVLGQVMQQCYPYASKVSEASYDSSLSSIAIDSKPIVGQTQLSGLFVNFAHGADHWALSLGCAQALADELAGVLDRFDLSPFSPKRFS